MGIDQNTLTPFTVKSYCIVTVKNALLKPVNYVTECTIRNFVLFVAQLHADVNIATKIFCIHP